MLSFLSPLFIFPIFYLIYIAFATVGLFISGEHLFKPRGYFEGVDFLSYIITFFFIAVFILGYKLGEKIDLSTSSKINYLKIILLLIIFVVSIVTLKIANKPIYLSLIFLIVLIFLSKLNLKQMAYLTTVLAVVIFVTTVLSEGLPFFSREKYIEDIKRASFLVFASASAAFSTINFRKRVAVPIVLILSAMGLAFGFKGDAVSILMVSILVGLFTGKIKKEEIFIFLSAVLIIITVFGTIIAVRTYSVWNIPPIEYLFYRPAFTFLVFNEIVKLSFPFGYLGKDALLVLDYKIVSMEVLGYSEPVSITTTLAGAVMLAYGIFGVVFLGLLLGLYLAQMFKIRDYYDVCLYALAIIHTVMLIEIGIPFSTLLYYLSILYLKFR